MLKDKQILLLGGSVGIGLALAEQLVEQGAQVSLVSRSKAKLDAAQASLGPQVKTFVLDATDEAAVARFFKECPPVDHLVATLRPNQAPADFFTDSTDQWKQDFEGKFWAQVHWVKQGLSKLNADGSIVLSAGIAANRGYPGFASMGAINGAVQSLVLSLARELSPIRINAVSPGFIQRQAEDYERYEQVKQLGARLVLGRLGSQEEAASGYLFLLQNRYVTGTTLVIDGGELCT